MTILRHQLIPDRTCLEVSQGDVIVIEHYGPVPPDTLQRLEVEARAFHDAIVRIGYSDKVRAIHMGPQRNLEKDLG